MTAQKETCRTGDAGYLIGARSQSRFDVRSLIEFDFLNPIFVSARHIQ